jgi:hypothetical protein
VPDPRPLILTVASGYRPEQLAPFVESWQRHLPGTDLVVIAGYLPEETNRYLDAAGVKIVPADFNHTRLVGWRKGWYRVQLAGWLRVLRSTRRWLGVGAEADLLYAHIAEASFHLFSQRFFHYRRYLRHFGWKYSHVLLVDIRDTIFQRSPFPCDGLHVFAENETIATNHFARRWFQLSYGNAVFRRLGQQPLLCAGVTLGDVAAVSRYLDVNCAESLKVSTVNDVDQAVHNFLIHENLVPSHLHAYGEGAAINLNAVSLGSLHVVEDRLLDAQHQPFAIVHQYDRVPGLKLKA